MEIQRPAPHQPIPPDANKVFSGVIFDVYQWQQEMFDGSTATFERLTRPDTVGVFPVLPDGSILLVREQQPGTGSFLSILGGRVEAEEAADIAAARELKEESGYAASSLMLWDAQQPVNKIDWAVYTFIARGATKVADQSLDPGERIELVQVSLDELIELVAEGACSVKEVASRFIEARYDDQKRQELRHIFDPAA
jgi:8-oxo-dGTP pyrophosphatase MutT (NUDIX family)